MQLPKPMPETEEDHMANARYLLEMATAEAERDVRIAYREKAAEMLRTAERTRRPIPQYKARNL
jgi:hypothetical protein